VVWGLVAIGAGRKPRAPHDRPPSPDNPASVPVPGAGPFGDHEPG
jgi:hypothetical protein